MGKNKKKFEPKVHCYYCMWFVFAMFTYINSAHFALANRLSDFRIQSTKKQSTRCDRCSIEIIIIITIRFVSCWAYIMFGVERGVECSVMCIISNSIRVGDWWLWIKALFSLVHYSNSIAQNWLTKYDIPNCMFRQKSISRRIDCNSDSIWKYFRTLSEITSVSPFGYLMDDMAKMTYSTILRLNKAIEAHLCAYMRWNMI